MDFAFSKDQEDFRSSLRRFLTDKAPLSAVRAASETDLGYDPLLWKQMSEQLGLPGLHIAEEHGGSGTGLLEPAVVLEETGRALSSSPYLAGLFASLAVQRLGSAEVQADLLPRIASGEAVVTLATIEVASPTGTRGLATTAQSRGDQVSLTGTKTLVEHGHSADVLLVSAVGADAPTGDARLYVVQGDAAGLTRTRQRTALDLTRPVAEVVLDGTPAVALGNPAPGALDDLVDLFCALLASEMVGGTEACLTMAVSYAKDRMQFNRPIGSFQAIKHKLRRDADRPGRRARRSAVRRHGRRRRELRAVDGRAAGQGRGSRGVHVLGELDHPGPGRHRLHLGAGRTPVLPPGLGRLRPVRRSGGAARPARGPHRALTPRTTGWTQAR